MRQHPVNRLLRLLIVGSAGLVAACTPSGDRGRTDACLMTPASPERDAAAADCDCADVYAPTCASDGQTYMNLCMLARADAELSRHCRRQPRASECRSRIENLVAAHEGRCAPPGGPGR